MCEEYKLHRETYYLTVDLHDRFLDSWREIQKEHLQAIGITCLFIASKIEVWTHIYTHSGTYPLLSDMYTLVGLVLTGTHSLFPSLSQKPLIFLLTSEILCITDILVVSPPCQLLECPLRATWCPWIVLISCPTLSTGDLPAESDRVCLCDRRCLLRSWHSGHGTSHMQSIYAPFVSLLSYLFDSLLLTISTFRWVSKLSLSLLLFLLIGPQLEAQPLHRYSQHMGKCLHADQQPSSETTRGQNQRVWVPSLFPSRIHPGYPG